MKVLFIESINANKLEIRNVPKKELIVKMQDIGLVQIKTTETGKEDYEYLLSLRVSILTLEEAEAMKLKRDEILDKIKILEETSVFDIWSHDLDALEKEYRQIEVANQNTTKGIEKWYKERRSQIMNLKKYKNIDQKSEKILNKRREAGVKIKEDKKKAKKAVTGSPASKKKRKVNKDDSDESDPY